MTDRTYFHIKNRGGSLETTGTPAYFLGHKIDRGPGAKPDGIFFEWSWDGKRLTVTNDRYGLYPLFYWQNRDEICVSPSIREILVQGAPNEFDHDALSVFLRLGFFVGDDTPFKHIRALPPDATFIYENGELTVSGRYATRAPIEMSMDDAIDRYIPLFQQAMKRRLPAPGEKFMVPISGGCDSRQILLELHRQGYKPDHAVTMRPYPPYYDEDIRIAKMVCEALEVQHTVLEHKNSYFANEIRALEMANYCSDEQGWFMDLTDHFKGKTNISYDGIAGDMFPDMGGFFNQGHHDLLRAGRYTEVSIGLMNDWSWMRPTDDVLKWSVGEDFFKKTGTDRAIVRMTEELKKFSLVHNPLTCFYFWNRIRRKIALTSYGVNAGVPKIYSPFLDYDLYDLLAALPDIPQKIRIKTIERAYPQYAHIPYEQNEAKKICVIAHQAGFTRDFAWHVLKGGMRSSEILNKRYLWPRMVKGLLNKKFRVNLWRLMPPILLYLIQLEKLQRAEGGVSETRNNR